MSEPINPKKELQKARATRDDYDAALRDGQVKNITDYAKKRWLRRSTVSKLIKRAEEADNA